MIFDTNVLIYLSKYILNSDNILKPDAVISVITKIEAPGYPFKIAAEHELLLSICNEIKIIPLTDTIAEQAINLRKNNRIQLPDAIIYATALVQNIPLLTNNISDFRSLGGKVKLINPFDL